MANLVANEENYGFNLEWIAEGSGIGEEICGVDKDCIVVPSSPILTKIEPVEVEPHQEGVDEYVEIQVTEEEVIADQWSSQSNSPDEETLHFRVDGHQEEDVMVPLPEEQDEYSRLHPYPCDFCSRRFSKKSALTVHMLSHQTERPHACNLCGASYSHKVELVEHMKIHAYAPVKSEEDDDVDYVQLTALTHTKAKTKSKKKKTNKDTRLEEYNSSSYGEQSDDKLNKRLKRQNASWSYLDEDVKIMVEMARQAAAPKFPVIDQSRPYVCQHCGVGFAREKALTSHTMVHVGDSAFECDCCHEMFLTDKLLEEHMMAKHEKYYLNMNRKKNNYSELRMNVKQEDPELECHVCTLCNLVFTNFDELLIHKEDHDPEIGIHACYLCNEVYEHIDDLKVHMKSVHRHYCFMCEKIFKDEKTLIKHNMLVHPDNKCYPCSVCHRRFNSKIKLKKHMNTHDGQKRGLVCIDCEQEFPDGQTLLSHRQDDHGINLSRLFPCMECGKTFNSRSSQQIHIRIHTGEKPYGCRFCWKAFGDGGTLRKHERIHTGEKPYVCPVCSKAFNQRVVLREHIRAHHSGTEGRLSDSCYECIVCGSIFVTSRDLYAHLVQHSDENTAKHRFPSSRKYTNKKRKTTTTYTQPFQTNFNSHHMTNDESSSHDEDPYPRKKTITQYNIEIQTETPSQSEPPSTVAPIVETTLNNGFDTLLSRAGPKRARIVRSGKKGVPKGQNKRFTKGKGKSSRLLTNASYASKYVVSQPDEDCINDTSPIFDNVVVKSEIPPQSFTPPPTSETVMNGNATNFLIPTKSRPRTKNVSYHNMRTESRFEIATFPVTRESKPKKVKRVQKHKVKKRDNTHISPPQPPPSPPPPPIQPEPINDMDTQFINGIDPSLFDDNRDTGEQIETCIVDDLDVELKLEVKTSDDVNLERIGDILIKSEMVSCDMCSESFDSRSELLKHIQIHI
ncbi:hypothetical protein O3M35_010290 [Rhynocoris fuscipes]|uniref:C2H2-type domain-containing protein n=1 Tax=Rhynocoris fuscipes TaxID=488301 RepID=A0AAW1CZP1_9HEMI